MSLGGARRADPAFEDWLRRARSAPVEAVLERVAPGHSKALRGRGERVGPCPVCRAGVDRFAINTVKNVWSCRRCAGIVGGDGIALARAVLGCDFLVAAEVSAGEPPPDRPSGQSPEERARLAEEARQRADEIAADAARRAADAERWREREREDAYRIWRQVAPLAGALGEMVRAYFAGRGIGELPEGLRIRAAADWTLVGELPRNAPRGVRRPVLHRGPAFFLPIVGANGHFLGVHATWIDPERPGDKVEVADPETGEVAPAKKVRGLKKGGRIVLVGADAPRRLFVGEGAETVLSVWTALKRVRPHLLEGAAFETSVDLGNLAGRAVDRVRHPTDTVLDRRGARRPVMVPGPTPDLAYPVYPVPDSVDDLYLLGDGDSEPVFTRLAIERAGRRWARPGRSIRMPFAPPGTDFNELIRSEVDG